jgi:hypothetical protein
MIGTEIEWGVAFPLLTLAPLFRTHLLAAVLVERPSGREIWNACEASRKQNATKTMDLSMVSASLPVSWQGNVGAAATFKSATEDVLQCRSKTCFFKKGFFFFHSLLQIAGKPGKDKGNILVFVLPGDQE